MPKVCNPYLNSIISASILFFGLNTVANAQVADRYKTIPGDSLVVTSIDVDAIRGLKEFEMVPWEIITAFGKQELGFDPLLITSVDICSGMPGVNGPEFGAVVKTKSPVNIAELSDRLCAELTTSPKNKDLKFRNLNGAPAKVVQGEAQTVLVGTEGTLRRMLGGRTQPGRAVELLSRSQEPFRSITMIEPLRPLLIGSLSNLEGMIPPQFMPDIETVCEELDYIQTGSSVGFKAELSIKFGTKDIQSAKRLMDAIGRLRKEGLVFAETLIMQQIQQDPQMTDEVKSAALAYVKRMKVFLSDAELWSVEGDEIVLKSDVAYSLPTIGVLTGLLLPAVQAAREASRRMSSSNNLKQLGLSLLNYEATYKMFPGQAIRDKDGKPLLSWRVAVLPYIEEVQLYKEFHLDEAWDSPHNIKLIQRMPPTFKHPSFVGPSGHTVYLAPFKKGTIWNLPRPKMANITDGTSNTIALVEVNDAHAVPWTKPEDLDMDQVSIADYLRPMASSVLFFDGSVQSIPKSISDQSGVLDAYVTSSGGELAPPLR